jgi:TldD protein
MGYTDKFIPGGRNGMGNRESVELAHFGLTEREIQQALGKVKVRDVDYADLYFE